MIFKLPEFKNIKFFYYTFISKNTTGFRVATSTRISNNPFSKAIFLFKDAQNEVEKEIGEKIIITNVIEITKEQLDNLEKEEDVKC